jgi:hypothetical protein
VRRRIAPAARMLALTLAGCLAGCSTPGGIPADEVEAAVWFPFADASLATVSRSTTFAVVHDPSHDLLVVQDRVERADGRASRFTWLVTVPSDLASNRRTAVGDPGAARGWLLEEIAGRPTYAAPLSGDITIEGRSAEAVTAVLALRVTGESPDAGQAMAKPLSLNRRITFDRRDAPTPQDLELPTRSGVEPPEEPEGDDRWW